LLNLIFAKLSQQKV